MPESPYSDLSRPPLNEAGLRRAVLRPDAFWTDLRVVPRTASTNADLADAARDGAVEGSVRVAEVQTAGRGRLGRSWDSPARAGLTFSLLLRPGTTVRQRGWPAVPSSRFGWLPLLAGLTLVTVVRRLGRIEAGLKWPNDVLAGAARGKIAGILAETVPGTTDSAVVVGIGLNVSLRRDELPRPDATSLVLEQAACVDRDPLLRALLREFADRYGAWRAAAGDPEASNLRGDYLASCDTVGRTVRVRLPGGGQVEGRAFEVDAEGRLVVVSSEGTTTVAAGEIVHLR